MENDTTESAESTQVEQEVAATAVVEGAKADRRRGTRTTDDPTAPYGRTAKGEPRKAPGRKKKLVQS